jgi:hypothetical protein
LNFRAWPDWWRHRARSAQTASTAPTKRIATNRPVRTLSPLFHARHRGLPGMPVGCDVWWNSLQLAMTLRHENRSAGPLWPAVLYGVSSTGGMWGGVNWVERIWK